MGNGHIGPQSDRGMVSGQLEMGLDRGDPPASPVLYQWQPRTVNLGQGSVPLEQSRSISPLFLKYRVIIVPWANKSRCARCCKLYYVCQETRGRAGTPRTCSSIGPGFAASLLINTFAQGSFIMFYI